MGTGMSKIVTGLYLGNIRDSEDHENLLSKGVTHILSVHNGAKPVLEDMTYLCISASDSSSQNLLQHFKESIQFIHECRLGGGGCLVHCPARGSAPRGDSCGIPSLTGLLPGQPGRRVPQQHPAGGIPDDSDRAGLAELPGCHQGRSFLRQPQPRLPAAAAGV